MEEVAGSIPASSTTEGPHGTSCGPSSFTLAGFVAGEGCFSVTRKLPPFADGDPRLRFVFTVQVATRDRPLLEALRWDLGVGSVRDRPRRKSHWQPSSTFTVASLRAHRRAVIPYFDRFLLGGAKRRQFELWVAAMDAYELAHPTNWGNGPSTCRRPGCDHPVRGRGLCRRHYYEETGW